MYEKIELNKEHIRVLSGHWDSRLVGKQVCVTLSKQESGVARK